MSIRDENRMVTKRADELRAQPTPEADGWFHGIRRDAIYRVRMVLDGVEISYSWQGVGGVIVIHDAPIPGDQHPELQHIERMEKRVHIAMAAMADLDITQS